MKRAMKQKYLLNLFSVLLLSAESFLCFGQSLDEQPYNLSFKPITTHGNLPSNEVTYLMQDSRGYIWIATNSGLCRYDGYRTRTYKDNFFTPGLLSDNTVTCMVEDQDNRLWIATRKGLNKLDMKTGVVSKIENKAFMNKPISSLHVDPQNRVWVVSNESLYYFSGNPDDELTPCGQLPGGEMVFGVKTLLTDAQGRLWVGTWDNGLFRYYYDENRFIAYPAFNKRNSVHILFQDSHGSIWAGSWGEGLFRADNIESPETAKWTSFSHKDSNPNSLSDNIIYCMEEDVTNNTLWIGTRNGLSIMDLNKQNGSFINYLPDNNLLKLPYNELNTIIRDRSGIMWLGMLGGGVYFADRRPTAFRKGNIAPINHLLYSNSVRALFIDNEKTLWMGIGSHGLAMQKKGNEPIYLPQHPDFKNEKAFHTINAIIQKRRTKDLWFATWGNGIYIYNKYNTQKTRLHRLTHQNTPVLPESNAIISLYEDREENVWVGFQGGVMVYSLEGKPIDIMKTAPSLGVLANVRVNAITQSSSGDLWLGGDLGIYRLSGSSPDLGKTTCKPYEEKYGNLFYANIQCLFEDSRGHFWAASEGGGLMLYDKAKDCFVSMNEKYGILPDAILNILEDSRGDIWLSTNGGLIRLQVSENAQMAALSTYTTTDGLSSNMYLRNSAVETDKGELLFGSHNGYDCLFPDKLQESEVAPTVVVTDFSVFNKSLSEFSDYTKALTLKHDQNHFSIEFSALSYASPSKNKYAYRLEGYDTKWQYTDASNRIANYSNLSGGKYTFYLKGSNENGLWNSKEEALVIEILPPPWKTTEAYLLYIALILLLLWLAYRIVRNRIRLRESIRMKEIEQSKAKEINHAKLQFFTNVTHEFLTPLTILSASLDELKTIMPGNKALYAVMNSNINRLIRLLQQILEFRKAESGNLKLKVSEGSITDFVKNAVEAFRPLMKKKSMDFTITCDPENIRGYFDPDKLDKILYNLLSNASKYNKEGNQVGVAVSYGDSPEEVSVTVRDNGEGLNEDDAKKLFTRFYEGDYRKYNTIGTGIGLSLTKDLVTLHKGEIKVDSEKGKGTAFTVILPITKEAYPEEQIGDLPAAKAEDKPLESSQKSEKPYTLLLVEDNEDLLALMVRLLEKEYTILTAIDGKQAIGIIDSNDVSLVVSDIMMPETDGVELCRYIKGQFDYCHIPVLLLTAKNQEEDRIEAYESGADGFLNKPFNTVMLQARIRNLLTKRERVARDFKKQLVFEVQDLNYTSMDEEFMQRAIAVVQKHLDDPNFDQQQFMDEMGTSKSTLYKKLKSLTGLNTSAFIRNIRLKAACRILEEKQTVRISELAYAVGFNDPKYFSSCFRKEFGLLPKEYHEQLCPDVNKGEL